MDRSHTRVRFNLFNLIRRLETLKGRRFSQAEIAEGAGIHPNTVGRVMDNRLRQVHFETLEGLLDYFESQGMPIELSDLLIVTQEETSG